MAEEEDIFQILLIDDEPLARFVARKALEKIGAFVTEAEDLGRAAELWPGNAFDLMVCDHRLPDGKGIDLIKKMRAEGRMEPVVYLTAEKEEITPEIQEELKISRVMGKPLDMEVFQEVLKGLSGGAAEEKGMSAAEGSALKRVGSFLVQSLAEECSVDSIRALRGSFADEEWMALDVVLARGLEKAGAQVLVEWADSCRAAGGCFCLVGLTIEQVGEGIFAWLSQEMDLVEQEDELLALSRHLSTPSERRAVLDSVVMRDLL